MKAIRVLIFVVVGLLVVDVGIHQVVSGRSESGTGDLQPRRRTIVGQNSGIYQPFQASGPISRPHASASAHVPQKPASQFNRAASSDAERRPARHSGANYETIYHWVDGNGIKRFSSQKPVGVEHYTSRTMRKSSMPSVSPQRPAYKEAASTTFARYAQSGAQYAQKRYFRTRDDILSDIRQYEDRIKTEQDRLSELKKELFDIQRSPGSLKRAEWRRARIAQKKEDIKDSQKRLDDYRAKKYQLELDLGHGKYDSE